MRTGPHPLPVHLGMAASSVAGIRECVQGFGAENLSESVLVEMMRGIKMYQEHPYAGDRKELNVIHDVDGVRLLRYPCERIDINKKNTRHILLVPSLVNSAAIFNLNEQRSFVRWMEERGISTYLLDWGDLHPRHDNITMDDIFVRFLLPAIDVVARINGGVVPDVLGYCMGGTLSLAAAALAPEKIGRIVLLAAPWDFQVQGAPLSGSVRIWSPFVLPILAQRGCLPAIWTQALFASLDPEGSVQKFIKFSQMDQQSTEAKIFIDVEDWLNDNVDIPQKIAQFCLQEWFAKNITLKRDWCVNGEQVDLQNIKNDVLIVASHRDKLVHYKSACAAEDMLSSARVDRIEANCGHISYIAGRNAIANIWEPICAWLNKNNS